MRLFRLCVTLRDPYESYPPMQLTMLDRELHNIHKHIMDFLVEVALTLPRKTKDQESLFEKVCGNQRWNSFVCLRLKVSSSIF